MSFKLSFKFLEGFACHVGPVRMIKPPTASMNFIQMLNYKLNFALPVKDGNNFVSRSL